MEAQILFLQAVQAVQGKDAAAARKLLAQCVCADPGHEQGWLLLARVMDDVDKAIECLNRALAVNPNNAEAQRWLALAQREKARAAASAEHHAPPEPEEPTIALVEPGDETRPVPRLGQYLLEFKFITEEQLRVALLTQRREQETGQARRLGDILLAQEAITEERLDFALREQQRSFYSLFND